MNPFELGSGFAPDRPDVPGQYLGPCIAAVHGFMARELMQNHLLHLLRAEGYVDSTMYSYLHPVDAIAEDLACAHSAGRPIVVVGYSQGGFQAVKIADCLRRQEVPVALLVVIGAGGLGRWLPNQWGANPRSIPANVSRCLNFFLQRDLLGADSVYQNNLAKARHWRQQVENLVFLESEEIGHAGLIRCYPPSRVHPEIQGRLVNRLLSELAGLKPGSTSVSA